MTVENPQTIIRSILTNSSILTPLINGRVYDSILPKNISMPCVQIQQVSETIDPINFFRRTTVQIDCYSESHPQADNIAELVMGELINHSQSETSGMAIINIKPDSLRDLSDPETRLYRVTGDYAVIWRK